MSKQTQLTQKLDRAIASAAYASHQSETLYLRRPADASVQRKLDDLRWLMDYCALFGDAQRTQLQNMVEALPH